MKYSEEIDEVTYTYTSLEVGSDREIEYIKVLSGKVIEKRPSFSSNDEISETIKEFD